VLRRATVAAWVTVAAVQYAFEGCNLAAENQEVVVHAAERRAPLHRTGTN